MSNRLIVTLTAVILGLSLSSVAAAKKLVDALSMDEAFIAARQAAYGEADPFRFEEYALRAGEHPLRVYLDYWRLRIRLTDSKPDQDTGVDEVARKLIGELGDSALGEQLRRDWLVNLGKRRDWAQFDTLYAANSGRDEPQLQCYWLTGQLERGRDIAEPVRELFAKPRAFEDPCLNLFSAAHVGQPFKPADLQARLRGALELNHTLSIRHFAQILLDPSLHRHLESALAKPAAALKTREVGANATLALIAFARLARADVEAAAAWLRNPKSVAKFDRPLAYALLAAAGQRKLLTDAHGWVKQAGAVPVSDDTLGWFARTALQANDHKLLRAVIMRMSEEQRADPTWVYWLAQSHARDGQRERASELLQKLSGQLHFYGQLADEELGRAIIIPPRAAPATEQEKAKIAGNAGLHRAIALARLGLRAEAAREWSVALRGASDRDLIAAAEMARDERVLDRSIAAAERTRNEHDFVLRFPAPFQSELASAASDRQLDAAWVYGLIRQESRFVMDARSSVGATGLMQLMPATARWVSRKIGKRDFKHEQLHDLGVNLEFGTFYLRAVLDDMDGSPLLASAAYNSGPNRPRTWRSQLGTALDGAAFAEIIPFSETRDYVKKVLANATVYAALLQQQSNPSLKSLLGKVTPRHLAGGASPLP